MTTTARLVYTSTRETQAAREAETARRESARYAAELAAHTAWLDRATAIEADLVAEHGPDAVFGVKVITPDAKYRGRRFSHGLALLLADDDAEVEYWLTTAE